VQQSEQIKMKTVLFDNETTGLLRPSPAPITEQPYIIEFYGVAIDDKTFKVIEEYECLIKPPVPVSDEITRITKISQDMVEDEDFFISHYEGIANLFLGAERMVAHNLSFDRSMLANELIRIDKLINFPWPIQHVCTVERSLDLEGYRLNLAKLYKKATGKDHEGAHRAKADVEALVECYKWLKKKKMV